MMNPELKPFLSEWDRQWGRLKPGATAADRRAHFEIIARDMRLPTPNDVDTEAEFHVDSSAGPVRVRIFRYRSDDVQPCLIYMHGGAWMQGSPETHWDITARLASWSRQTVISVDYALAPERPFPAGLDQTIAVARWAHAKAVELGIDPRAIAIGGDSAGANLAAAAAIDLRGEIPLSAQLLVYPACDFDTSRPSYAENADGPIVKTAGMDMVNRSYCPTTEDLSNPRVAPLLAETHQGLPPAFVAVAQFDPLRDSGLAYADALRAAGVPVELDRGEGLIHGYLRAMDFCDDSMEKLRKMARWLADRDAGTST